MLVHLTCGLVLPYILLRPALAPPDVLQSAASHAGALRIAVLLLFASGAATVAIALLALPHLRRHGERIALLLVVLGGANLVLHALENATLLSMLSLSARSAELEPQRAAGLAAMLGDLRRGAHLTQLLIGGGWLITLHAALGRACVVPRSLAALGVVAALVQVVAVPLRGLVGLAPIPLLAIPLAPIYAACGGWLVLTGFRDAARAAPR